MATRKERVKALKEATLEYIKAERARLENEASVLKAVLDGRTGGKGVQENLVKVVTAAAEADLAAYLK